MAVYIALRTSDGLVKIGTSRKPAARIKELSYRCRSRLIMLRTMDGTYPQEKWMHQRFGKQRVVGEWFNFDAAMMTVAIPEHFLVEVPAPPAPWSADAMAELQRGMEFRSPVLVAEMCDIPVSEVGSITHGVMPSQVSVDRLLEFFRARDAKMALGMVAQ